MITRTDKRQRSPVGIWLVPTAAPTGVSAQGETDVRYVPHKARSALMVWGDVVTLMYPLSVPQIVPTGTERKTVWKVAGKPLRPVGTDVTALGPCGRTGRASGWKLRRATRSLPRNDGARPVVWQSTRAGSR